MEYPYTRWISRHTKGRLYPDERDPLFAFYKQIKDGLRGSHILNLTVLDSAKRIVKSSSARLFL
jgi:hypothetical protein